MRRAISLLLFFAALQVRTVYAGAPMAAPHRAQHTAHEVRITPTALRDGDTSIEIGDSVWSVQGYDLRGLLARVYDIDPARVQVDAAELADAHAGGEAGASRFDVSLALNGDETDEAIQQMLRKALEDRFGISTSLETRATDAYVLTAPAGPGRGLHAAAEMKFSAKRAAVEGTAEPLSVITVEGRVCPGISSAGITAQSATVERLAAALEDNLDRVVVDETGLAGAYDFEIPEYRSRQELFSVLQDQLGLKVRTERREIKVLAVRSAAQRQPELLTGL